MAVKIRLARGGAKKRPFYRIVVADVRAPRDGRYIERIGSYNPMVAKDAQDRLRVDAERLQYWVSQGAQMTDRVARMLSEINLADKPVIREQSKKHLPKAKAQERLAEREEKARAAAEAAAAPAEEAPAEETAAEEAPAEEKAE